MSLGRAVNKTHFYSFISTTDSGSPLDKPKEIGIPNSFPFKDQLLAEAQAEKVRVSFFTLFPKLDLTESTVPG